MSALAAAPASSTAWATVTVDSTNEDALVDVINHARASDVVGIRCMLDGNDRLVVLLLAAQQTDRHHATVYLVDLVDADNPFHKDSRALEQLRALLGAPSPLKLFHNAQQDVPPLSAWVGGPVRHLLDTLVLQAMQPIYPHHPPPAPPAPLAALLAHHQLEPPGFDRSLFHEFDRRGSMVLAQAPRPIPKRWRAHFTAEASALIALADSLYSSLVPDLATHLKSPSRHLVPHCLLLSQSAADWKGELSQVLIGEKQATSLRSAYQLSGGRSGRPAPVRKIGQRPTYKLRIDDKHQPSLTLFCPSLARGWLQDDAAAAGQGFQWDVEEDQAGACEGSSEDEFLDSDGEGAADPELDESPEARLSRRLGEVQGVDPDLATVLRVLPRRVAEAVLEVLQCRPGLKPSMVVEIKADYDLPMQVRLTSGENLALNIRADIRELLAALHAGRALLEQEAPAGLARPPPVPEDSQGDGADDDDGEWGSGWAQGPAAPPAPIPSSTTAPPAQTPNPVQLPPSERDYAYNPPDPFVRKDNRLAFPGTLHRISCMRHGTSGQVIGLTYRVGRYVEGVGEIFRDLLARMCARPLPADPLDILADDEPDEDVQQGAMLILGAPGCGKTTILRDLCRIAANVLKKNAIIVDTSNEIAGDGTKPHPCIGGARRMMVVERNLQHRVLEEAVQNHTPEVVIIDEISNRQEVAAVRTIVQRGISMIATAHGQTLSSLLKNPQLAPLVGGVKEVTLGDMEARRQGVSKHRHEREGPPAFSMMVEVLERNRFRVHLDVAESVDRALRGAQPITQLRSYAPDGTMLLQFPNEESIRPSLQHFTTTAPAGTAPAPAGSQHAPTSARDKALARQNAFLLDLIYKAALPIRDGGVAMAPRQPTPPEPLSLAGLSLE